MLTLIMSYRRMFFFLLVPIHQPLGGTSQSPLRGNRFLNLRRSPKLYFRRQKLIQYLRETGRDNHQSIRSQQCFKSLPRLQPRALFLPPFPESLFMLLPTVDGRSPITEMPASLGRRGVSFRGGKRGPTAERSTRGVPRPAARVLPQGLQGGARPPPPPRRGRPP